MKLIGGKKIVFLGLLVAAGLLVSGCSLTFNNSDGSGVDGGIFISDNKGKTWASISNIANPNGKVGTISSLDSNCLEMDPSDSKALYYGSTSYGLFFSFNINEDGWSLARKLGQLPVAAVAVDPKDKCTIYAASENKVYQSSDCNRSWSQVYYDNNPQTKINDIEIDRENPKNIYIATSRGEVIKSSDAGVSWRTAARLGSSVKKVITSPFNARLVMAATVGSGVHRSFDGGENWIDLSDGLKQIYRNSEFRDIAFSPAQNSLIFLASNYGLLKSENNGTDWSKVELITPEKGAIINAIALGPDNGKDIYYVTNTTFFRSADGGENWGTRKLPTTRAGWRLAVDPLSPQILYLSTMKIN